MTAFSLLAASPLLAALVPLSPADGQEVALVPDAQKTVMNRPTLEARIKMFKEDRRAGKTLKHDKSWRRSRPLVLEVRTASGEQGPWKVLVGKRADLSDARIWYLPADVRPGGGGAAKDVVRLEVPKANLEIATLYHWKVIGREGGKDKKRTVETPVASFVTEDFAPRWIVLDGPVGNVRDMGGRLGLGGRRVRQGLVYRGQGLNGCSVTGEAKGPNRLTVEDVDYLTGTLGIRTDLDLRSKEQIADLTSSPLGPSVKFIWHSSLAYADIFSEAGKRNMAENFRVFCDRGNYPVYFHCIMGADRTGSLAYVLNGVLGVSRHELETDWEATFYPEMPDENEDLKCWRRESHFNDGFAKYGDADTPWNDRIVLYLRDCGITDEEIAAFRGIMLEGPAFVSDLGSIVRTGRGERPARAPDGEDGQERGRADHRRADLPRAAEEVRKCIRGDRNREMVEHFHNDAVCVIIRIQL